MNRYIAVLGIAIFIAGMVFVFYPVKVRTIVNHFETPTGEMPVYGYVNFYPYRIIGALVTLIGGVTFIIPYAIPKIPES